MDMAIRNRKGLALLTNGVIMGTVKLTPCGGDIVYVWSQPLCISNAYLNLINQILTIALKQSGLKLPSRGIVPKAQFMT